MALPDGHPALEREEYAIVQALTEDDVYGKAPGYQVVPILRHLDEMGWMLVRKPVAEGDA